MFDENFFLLLLFYQNYKILKDIFIKYFLFFNLGLEFLFHNNYNF